LIVNFWDLSWRIFKVEVFAFGSLFLALWFFGSAVRRFNMAKRFKELEVYQLAEKLSDEIWGIVVT